MPAVITQKVLNRMNLDLKDIKAKITNLNSQEIGDDQKRAAQWKRTDINPVFDDEELQKRVQEARDKYPPLWPAWPDLRLHLIGPLQTNKVRDAVALFDVIETVDRENLARALAVEPRAQDG